ncbi:MAG: MBL fold metallo-hydrolase [Planctomycetota bacterium]
MPTARVRMYRHGLGDCFLLTFTDTDGNDAHALIDCGSLGGGEISKSDAIELVGKHIGDDGLSLLVITHEHDDHVGAFRFKDGKKFLAETEIANVWLAWTEDPNDPDAQAAAQHINDLGRAVVAAQSMPGIDAKLADRVDSLLGFVGEPALRFANSVNDAMHRVRTETTGRVRYLSPGDGPIEPAWAPGFRFYVLGPPRAENARKNEGKHGSEELYGFRAALRAAGAVPNGIDLPEEHEAAPFDARYTNRGAITRSALYPNYDTEENSWRKIDTDWMHGVADLALQLDHQINNTSLVLAIERIADGKVMLFPGDAQEGSWLSWHGDAISWSVEDPDGDERQVNAADLLSRTVFYKVGHHGSHNATAKGKGLELMGPDLVAFIPVSRETALERNPKGSWKMPAKLLYTRLLERCRGRVIRSDIGWAAEVPADTADKTEKEFIGIGSNDSWEDWREAQASAQESGILDIDNQNPFYDFVLK